MKLSANAARSLVASQSFPCSTSKSSNMPELEASTKHPEKIFKCNECDSTFTTQDLIIMNLNHWRSSSKSDNSLEEPMTWNQLDGAWLDVAAARYPYETFGEGGNEGSASSWLFTADKGRSVGHLYKNKARHTLLHLFYDEHDHRHRKTCFKKESECRFNFPWTYVGETLVLTEDDRRYDCLNLLGEETRTTAVPFIVLPHRSIGSGEIASCSSCCHRLLLFLTAGTLR